MDGDDTASLDETEGGERQGPSRPGEDVLVGDGVEPSGGGVEMGEDHGDRAPGPGIASSDGAVPGLRPGVPDEGDRDAEGLREDEAFLGRVPPEGMKLEGELLGVAHEGGPGETGAGNAEGGGGERDARADGADGAVGTGVDPGGGDGGGAQGGPGELVGGLDGDEASAAAHDGVEDGALEREVHGLCLVR